MPYEFFCMSNIEQNVECWVRIQLSSVAQLHPTVCDSMDCSMPSFPVHHQLPELNQTMSIESVMPSNHLILCHPLLLLPSIFPSIKIFSNHFFTSSGQSIGVSASASVLPMNSQDWFPLGSPCSPRDSQESPPTPQFKSINSLVLSFLYSPTLTSIHDYWRNHNLD